jgi:hypothetical protein
MARETCGSRHSAVCLRLMELLPRMSRGMLRFRDRTTPQTSTRLSLRHVAVAEQLREGPLTVGALAAWLDLMLPRP